MFQMRMEEGSAMTYHALTKDSGGTADDRRSEADRLVRIIMQLDLGSMTPKESDFIAQMEEGGAVTTKQLFWLRDIKDKYL